MFYEDRNLFSTFVRPHGYAQCALVSNTGCKKNYLVCFQESSTGIFKGSPKHHNIWNTGPKAWLQCAWDTWPFTFLFLFSKLALIKTLINICTISVSFPQLWLLLSMLLLQQSSSLIGMGTDDVLLIPVPWFCLSVWFFPLPILDRCGKK